MRDAWFIFCGIFLLFLRTEAKKLYVIDIGYSAEASLGEKIAVMSCQGLMNRKQGAEEEIAVYTLKDHWDPLWLDDTLEQDPEWDLLPLSINEFLTDVCEKENFAKILYSHSRHHELIPQIITIAGVLDAVPLNVDSGMDQISSWISHNVAFDVELEFFGFKELEATAYIFDNFAHLTTGVSMMNPGWRQPDDLHPGEHELVRDPSVGLLDLIIKERLFNFFLYEGCIPATEEHLLMARMMTDINTSWKKPIEVFGYNDAIMLFGGWTFEAETNCIAEHNMGQVASSDVNNYSFFNRKASITTPEELEIYLGALLKTRQDIADGTLVYDPTKTYMTFILGDGDNTAFMKASRREWMLERVEHCKETDKCLFPLSWTMSPHFIYLTPGWLHWYYALANETGQDVFILPPSGHLYAYPGMMDDESTSNSFVESTQQDCKLLSATGSVHWEWFFGWEAAFENYFPKYATTENSESCMKSFFATNVPYNFYPDPTEFPEDAHFRALDGDVIVFKPREWRGTNKDNIPIFGDLNYLTEEEMAAEINGYKIGSVSHLYLTSDGGMNLETLYTMIDMLEDHVKVVNHEELTEMARQKNALSLLEKL